MENKKLFLTPDGPQELDESVPEALWVSGVIRGRMFFVRKRRPYSFYD